MKDDLDSQVRQKAFKFLDEQKLVYGELLPRSVLAQGFDFNGHRVPLVAPQGIFKPRILDLPLTITTVPPNDRKDRPYEDEIGYDGTFVYKYRGTDPNHPNNRGLEHLRVNRVPLIYLMGIVEGWYYPVYPVCISGNNPRTHSFIVTADDPTMALNTDGFMVADGDDRRRYVTREIQQRLHQHNFRERVLKAYLRRCTICQLRHTELLDAAHILDDKHPKGYAIVTNGLSLCKIHHTAFDRNFLGISPDYEVKLRDDILEESDGPMLKYGLQAFHEKTIFLPRDNRFKPDQDYLAERFDKFRNSA